MDDHARDQVSRKDEEQIDKTPAEKEDRRPGVENHDSDSRDAAESVQLWYPLH